MKNIFPLIFVILFMMQVLTAWAENVYDDYDLFEKSNSSAYSAYKNVDGFMEIIIRDSQGNLVGFLKTDFLDVLDNEVMTKKIDNWPVKQIVRNGQNYELLQSTGIMNITKEKNMGGSGGTIVIDGEKRWGLYAYHDQYPAQKGDIATIIYSIFQKI